MNTSGIIKLPQLEKIVVYEKLLALRELRQYLENKYFLDIKYFQAYKIALKLKEKDLKIKEMLENLNSWEDLSQALNKGVG